MYLSKVRFRAQPVMSSFLGSRGRKATCASPGWERGQRGNSCKRRARTPYSRTRILRGASIEGFSTAQEFFCGHLDECIVSRYNICRVEMTLRPHAGSKRRKSARNYSRSPCKNFRKPARNAGSVLEPDGALRSFPTAICAARGHEVVWPVRCDKGPGQTG